MRFKLNFPLVFVFNSIRREAISRLSCEAFYNPKPNFRRSLAIAVILFGALCGPPTQAADATAMPFDQGVIDFQKSDFKSARTSFAEILKSDPNNVTALYNLGLTEQKAGNTGLALALWRKALALAPGFLPARRALIFTTAHLEHAEIPHEVEFWETLHASVLAPYSLNLYLLLTAIFFGLGTWTLLTQLGARRRARLDESAMPGFPSLSAFSLVLFVLFAALTVSKMIDDETLRGTIVAKKVEALSSPEASATPLFDLYEGLEVLVRETHGDWVQVSYPGGSTGWIQKTTLLTTSDSPVSKPEAKAVM